jgi:aryl carrier-like protein
VLSTGMLSASNFCIQLQASPTRADVDHVHKHNNWLDIGVPSLRNLRYISWWRLISYVILALSSLPIHLM